MSAACFAAESFCMSENPFVTGGTLPLNASSYVVRQADDDFFATLAAGQYCYLLNTRQMGKSSLVVRAAERLRQECGASVAVFELSAIGQNISPDQFYYGLGNLIGQQLHLEDELDDFWFDNESLSPMQRFFEFIRRVALPASSGPLVIVVDEVDVLRTVQKYFSTDEFFGGIRDCHNRRATQEEFARLTFCLVGVATPADLIADTRVSPFNIGQRVVITDFTDREAAGLATNFGTNGKVLLDRVMYWTGGHPYLTQRLCHELVKQEDKLPADVDRECERLFLSKTARESDINLTFVRDRLLRSEHKVEEMLDLYAKVRSGKPIYDDETNPLFSVLRLSGIAKVMDGRGRLVVRNRIYEKVFDADFVRENMPDAEQRRQSTAARRGRFQVGSVAAAVVAVLSLLLWQAIEANGRAEEATKKAEADGRRTADTLTKLKAKAGELEDAQKNLKQLTDNIGIKSKELTEAGKKVADAKVAVQGAEAQEKSAATALQNALLKQKVADNKRIAAEKIVQAADNKVRAAEAKFAAKQHQVTELTKNFGATNVQLAAARTDLAKAKADVIKTKAESITAENNARAELAKLQAAVGQAKESVAKAEQQANEIVLEAKGREKAASENATRLVYVNRITEAQRAYDNKNVDLASDYLSKAKEVPFGPRGFEWNHLNALCNTRRMTVLPSKMADAVRTIGYSPSGKMLAVGGNGVKGLTVDANTGVPKADYQWPRSAASALSPDSKYYAVGSGIGLVTIYNSLGNEIDRFRIGTTKVTSLAFAPIGDPFLIAGGANGAVVVWNLETRTQWGRGIPMDSPIVAVAIDKGGARAIVTTAHQSTIYRLADNAFLATLHDAGALTKGVAFSWQGDKIASVDDSKKLHFFDPNGTLLDTKRLPDEIKTPGSVTFDPSGAKVAVGGENGKVALVQLDEATTNSIVTPLSEQDSVFSLCMNDDGSQIFVGNGSGRVTKWTGTDKKASEEVFRSHGAGKWAKMALSPNGKRLLCGWYDGSIALYDLERRVRVPGIVPQETGLPITAVAFAPDGMTLAAARNDGTVTVWSGVVGKPGITFQAYQAEAKTARYISALSFSPDSSHLVTGGFNGIAHLFTKVGVRERSFPCGAAIYGIAFAPQKEGLFAAALDNDTLALCSASAEQPAILCRGHTNTVSCLAFAPDGQRLVSGSYDGTVKLWDTNSGQQMISLQPASLKKYPSRIFAVAFAGDGSTVAIGTESKQIIVLKSLSDP